MGFGLNWVQPPPGNYMGNQNLQCSAASAAAAAPGTKSSSAMAELRRRGGENHRGVVRGKVEPRPVLGWSIVVAAVGIWAAIVYSTVTTQDGYYCYLLPMLIPC